MDVQVQLLWDRSHDLFFRDVNPATAANSITIIYCYEWLFFHAEDTHLRRSVNFSARAAEKKRK